MASINRRGGWNQGRQSGTDPDVAGAVRGDAAVMPCFLIQHHHEADECGAVFASFKGHETPLRRHATLASCAFGGHAIWWRVEARNAAEALELLPAYVAARAIATRVGQVEIP
jgi:hypothetical protein